LKITELEKFLLIVLFAVIVMFFQIGVVNTYLEHRMTRYVVRTSTDPDGKIVFEHEDKETTEILNYLSGRADLPKEKKLELARRMIKFFLQSERLAVPKDIDSMDENNLRKVCDSSKLCTDILVQTKHWALPGQSWFETLVGWPPRYDEKLYSALWEIERIGGNPKIRWSDGIGGGNRTEGVFNTYYRPSTNTIYLQLPIYGAYFAASDFVAEAAHGKQHNEQPIKNYFLKRKEVVTGEISSLILGVSLFDVLDLLYQKPGSTEYEAHKVIEPELREKLPVMFFAPPQHQ